MLEEEKRLEEERKKQEEEEEWRRAQEKARLKEVKCPFSNCLLLFLSVKKLNNLILK